MRSVRPAALLPCAALLCACATPRAEVVSAGGAFARFTDSTGRSGEFGLWSPPGPARGALVLLHADDGIERYAEWLAPAVRALAARHGLVLASLQEPDRGCWWAPRAGADARYVLDFLERELVAKRGIDRSRLFVAGKSGGGFLAAGLPARSGYAFGGAIIGLCGGDIPRLDGGRCEDDTDAPPAPDVAVPASPPALSLWFASTTGDEYLPYERAAAAYYRERGLPVVERSLGAGGHCEFDLVRELETAVEQVDAK
jgi:poly(3-hydroxybutyrate) depolymerase